MNRPRVIAQEIDGEVVAIDLHTGNYYSLRGTAAPIWAALESAAGLPEIIEHLEERYASGTDGIEGDVTAFLEGLAAEELIVPLAEGEEPPSVPASANGSSSGAPRDESLEPPVLEKFDDMQDLILLDPVHEVAEEQGWPHRP
ncbi:MAG: PqqD family protein [Actinomycetota bacterium]